MDALYDSLRNAIASLQRDINDREKDIRDRTQEYHHPAELLAMLTATIHLCEFILEYSMECVETAKGQEFVQTAIHAYKHYASVATKSEQDVHDFRDTIFFLQWLLVSARANN